MFNMLSQLQHYCTSRHTESTPKLSFRAYNRLSFLINSFSTI